MEIHQNRQAHKHHQKPIRPRPFQAKTTPQVVQEARQPPAKRRSHRALPPLSQVVWPIPAWQMALKAYFPLVLMQ